jgi:hypothetical protein
MVLAPFRVFLTLIVLDSDFDLPKDLLAYLADGCAESRYCVRSVEVKDVQEVLVAEIPLRFKTASRQHGVCGADNSGVSEGRSYVEIIILIQKRPVNDTEDVILIVIPVFIHKLGGDTLKLLCDPVSGVHIKTALQRGCYGVVVFVTVRPKIRAAGSFPAACI